MISIPVQGQVKLNKPDGRQRMNQSYHDCKPTLKIAKIKSFNLVMQNSPTELVDEIDTESQNMVSKQIAQKINEIVDSDIIIPECDSQSDSLQDSGSNPCSPKMSMPYIRQNTIGIKRKLF